MLVILGPTGTGKSELAIDVARRLQAEIVGCDAFQVYRGLDAATAKPPIEDRRAVPHHLLDCADPENSFTAAEYVHRAEAAIDDVARRGRVPLVVGGAGFYLRGLLRGLIEAPATDPRLRARLRTIAERRGTSRLHRWLSRLDPASARRIAENDVQRVVRGLELALGAERTWSARLREQGTWGNERERYANVKIGLTMERDELYRRLDRRVDRFFEAGLIDEARRLASTLPAGANALKAIGYREVLQALREGRSPEAERERIRRSTRRYAKRQLTWFRKERDVLWLDAARPRSENAARVVQRWNG